MKYFYRKIDKFSFTLDQFIDIYRQGYWYFFLAIRNGL